MTLELAIRILCFSLCGLSCLLFGFLLIRNIGVILIALFNGLKSRFNVIDERNVTVLRTESFLKIRFLVCHSLLLVAGIVVAVATSTLVYDYTPILAAIRAEKQEFGAVDCLALPPYVWKTIEKCNPDGGE
jgi:hypothetical protein